MLESKRRFRGFIDLVGLHSCGSGSVSHKLYFVARTVRLLIEDDVLGLGVGPQKIFKGRRLLLVHGRLPLKSSKIGSSW